MPASPLDSALYRDLFGDRKIAQLFTDSAEIRALLLVEGALAKAQAAEGVIPDLSGAAIHRAAMEVQIDPGALAVETSQSAVVVPALVAAFRHAMEAPEHAQFIHWGATSQDIIDTALTLRLRKVLDLYEQRLTAILGHLASLADDHADLAMAGRTYGQTATPTSFGAMVAGWGAPLLASLQTLPGLRRTLLHVSLSGAAGTLSVMGDKGPAVRAGFAQALGLSDPGRTWHSNRSSLTGLSAWATEVATALGKCGEDILLMTQSGIEEVRLTTSGGSSTMPQKSNPVAPSVLSALARHSVGLNSTLQLAMLHRQQRDGAAWFTEWLTLPQLCETLGGALRTADHMLAGLIPNAPNMARQIDPNGLGLIYAEALSFTLAAHMRRPEAQARTKALCAEAIETGAPLLDLAKRAYPGVDLSALTARHQLGQAPAEARAFAKAVRDQLA